MNRAWKDIADCYNDFSWEPINPVIDPFNVDDFGNPLPVHNCSQERFELLHHIDPNSDQIRRDATPGFVQVTIIVRIHCLISIFLLFISTQTQILTFHYRSKRYRLCIKKLKFICLELPIIIPNLVTIKEASTHPMVRYIYL